MVLGVVIYQRRKGIERVLRQVLHRAPLADSWDVVIREPEFNPGLAMLGFVINQADAREAILGQTRKLIAEEGGELVGEVLRRREGPRLAPVPREGQGA